MTKTIDPNRTERQRKNGLLVLKNAIWHISTFFFQHLIFAEDNFGNDIH